MEFRTELTPASLGMRIDHRQRGFLAGSCFAENICARLRQGKFTVTGNPFGVMFNPLSVYNMLRSLAAGKVFTAGDLRKGHDGRWFSYEHHGFFSDEDPAKALRRINEASAGGTEALRSADYVILTFGTAWIYRLVADGSVVANCHKQPASEFVRERMSAESIVDLYAALLENELKDKQVILTVSPVRHLKDGFDGNSLSKAILRVAAGELAERYERVHYFPAYEILVDDLRDYRFYAADMVHPSQMAIDYVWQKFTESAMDEHTRALLPRLAKIGAAMEHRVTEPQSEQSRAFANRMLNQLVQLQQELPEVDFSQEENYFASLG